jgi:hypothetical protein
MAGALKASLLLSTPIEVPGGLYLDRNSHPAALAGGFIGEDFVNIFADILAVTTFIGSLPFDEGVKLDRAMFGERVFLIDLQLTASIKDFTSHDFVMHHTREILRFSCLLYVNVVLRDFPRSTKIICRLASKLQCSLLSSEVLRRPFTTTPLLKLVLWALFIGMDCTVDKSESAWYPTALAQFCVLNSFRRWKDIRMCLIEVCWLEIDCDTRCKSHWADILEVIINC